MTVPSPQFARRVRDSLRLSRFLGYGGAVVAMLLAVVLCTPARAGGLVQGKIKTSTDNGFARLAFEFDEPVSAKIQMAWPVMIVSFDKPVALAVDKLNAEVKGYISVARRDPDGSAIRIALSRKVRIHSIPAGKRLFIDLLPETWTGLLPGLPQDVIDELARKAAEADRLLQQKHMADARADANPIRVKAASQPTFTRYIFNMPRDVRVSTLRGDGTFALNFDQPLKWDLADALSALPPAVQTISAKTGESSATVKFLLKGMPSVRSFRDGGDFVVDIGGIGATSQQTLAEDAARLAAAAHMGAPVIPAPDKGRSEHARAGAQQPPAKSILPPVADEPAAKPAGGATKVTSVTPSALPESSAPPVKNAGQPSIVKPELAARPNMLPARTPAPSVTMESAKANKLPRERSPSPDTKRAVIAALNTSGDMLHLEFDFANPTAAAVFRRADVVWLVFDSPAPIEVGSLPADSGGAIRSATFERAPDGAGVVRLHLQRPRLVSVDSSGPAWLVTIGDTVTVPSRPLGVVRSIVGKDRGKIVVPFARPGTVHHFIDPEIGDRLLVITALAPVRGLLQSQDFVQLQALASQQGVVVRLIADDVVAELSNDKITFSKPGGLVLSGMLAEGRRQAASSDTTAFDIQRWDLNRKADYEARQSELIRYAADAPPEKRRQARMNLARFYLARHMAAEAKGVLDVSADSENGAEDVTGSVLSAVANLMLDRPRAALTDLDRPQVGARLNAPVWRAIAYSREGKWAEAHAAFKNIETAVAALPVELQRMALLEALRSAVEVRDFMQASRLVDECESIGMPGDAKPTFDVLVGRLDEGVGRTAEALAKYQTAAKSDVGPAAAQGRLRAIELRFSIGEMSQNQVIAALETLTTVWRGDETEVEGLRLLAHLYTKEARYREAFHVMRVAMLAHPNSDLTRKIQDEASATFDSLFLSHKGDTLPPIEALGLFYDYRELTPIGRRGDEMIRRLADRLVAVDLLYQAAELLQHQVDHRLQGAARAQVATRLAVIYLMDHKPDRALAVLQSTRMAQLNDDLRDQRLLLEARALSDIGRYDLALELTENLKSHEAMRLRADILWAAKRWRAAAEQIELLYGDRWRQLAPLNASERSDIMRAAIGYALADEPLSLARFREKYAVKMDHGPDRQAFEVVSAPIGTGNAEFRVVARRIASIDTLKAFLQDLHKRYPDSDAISSNGIGKKEGTPPAKGQPSTPRAVKGTAADAAPKPSAPKTVPARPVANAADRGTAPSSPQYLPPGATSQSDVPTGSLARR